MSARFSVWFSRVRASPNCLDARRQHFEAAGIVRRQLLLASHQIQRRAPLRAGFGENQRAILEVKCGEADLARDLWTRLVCAFGGPLEAAGDHQVNDEEQVALELPHEPLAKPPEGDDLLAVGLIDRRIEGADEERAGEPDALEPLTDDARLKRMQVQLDVWKFRHQSGHRNTIHRFTQLGDGLTIGR